jgi:hypothetical protein
MRPSSTGRNASWHAQTKSNPSCLAKEQEEVVFLFYWIECIYWVRLCVSSGNKSQNFDCLFIMEFPCDHLFTCESEDKLPFFSVFILHVLYSSYDRFFATKMRPLNRRTGVILETETGRRNDLI